MDATQKLPLSSHFAGLGRLAVGSEDKSGLHSFLLGDTYAQEIVNTESATFYIQGEHLFLRDVQVGVEDGGNIRLAVNGTDYSLVWAPTFASFTITNGSGGDLTYHIRVSA